MDIRCRMCNENDETVYHLICSCPKLAPTLYLEARHNQIARILYQEIMKNEKINYNPPRVTIKNEIELGWDMEIHTVTKVKKNQPDIVLWNHELKTCQIIEITVPIDTNLKEAYHQKEIKYITLIAEMQRMYSDYKFSTTVITIGALGAVPKNLDLNLRKLNFEKEKIAVLIQRIQRAALTGTLKVCKTVRKMLNEEWLYLNIWTIWALVEHLLTLLYCLRLVNTIARYSS